MARIAFVGLGNMGGPMAANLVKAGHDVTGYDVVPSSLKAAGEAGITPASSLAEAVAGAETVVTMLPAGAHVLSVYEGEAGILAKAPAGALLVDCSTIDIATAHKAHALAAKAGMQSLDAPVSGGVAGAQAASLAIMAGGEAAAFDRGRPLLEVMGKRVVHCGEPGAGQARQDVQQYDPRHFHDWCV